MQRLRAQAITDALRVDTRAPLAPAHEALVQRLFLEALDEIDPVEQPERAEALAGRIDTHMLTRPEDEAMIGHLLERAHQRQACPDYIAAHVDAMDHDERRQHGACVLDADEMTEPASRAYDPRPVAWFEDLIDVEPDHASAYSLRAEQVAQSISGGLAEEFRKFEPETPPSHEKLEHLGLALCAWRQDLQSREDLSERARDRACATIESALHALRRLWHKQPYHGWRPMSARPHTRNLEIVETPEEDEKAGRWMEADGTDGRTWRVRKRGERVETIRPDGKRIELTPEQARRGLTLKAYAPEGWTPPTLEPPEPTIWERAEQGATLKPDAQAIARTQYSAMVADWTEALAA